MWRVKSDLILEPLEFLSDGSYRSVLVSPKVTAATAAGIDPDRVKFKRAVRIIRRRIDDPAFPP